MCEQILNKFNHTFILSRNQYYEKPVKIKVAIYDWKCNSVLGIKVLGEW